MGMAVYTFNSSTWEAEAVWSRATQRKTPSELEKLKIMSCVKRLLKEMRQYHTLKQPVGSRCSEVWRQGIDSGNRFTGERDEKAAVGILSCFRRISSEFWSSGIRLPFPVQQTG